MGGTTIAVSEKAKNFGVIPGIHLAFVYQVNVTFRAIFYHARSLLHIWQLLPDSHAEAFSKARRRNPIQPVLFSLHCLHIALRINIKVARITFKICQTVETENLASLIHDKVITRSLRSWEKCNLEIPRRLTQTRQCSFSFVVPSIWNSLPDNISQQDHTTVSTITLKNSLKHLLHIVYT